MLHPDPLDWWKHRRRLAYASMFGLFALVGAAWFMPAEQIMAATAILTAVAWMFGLVIGGYIGTAMAEDIVKLRGQR